MAKEVFVPAERIERSILLIRGQKILLDRDLAELYGVETRTLVQAVKRNRERFPDDFMFQLSWDEVEQLSRSQFVILKRGHNVKFRPYAFTEQGVAMLSSVLRSKRAVQVNIAIMRAFVRSREILATHKDLTRKLAEHEKKLGEHDEKIQIVLRPFASLWRRRPPQKNAAFDSRLRTTNLPKRDSGTARKEHERLDTRSPSCASCPSRLVLFCSSLYPVRCVVPALESPHTFTPRDGSWCRERSGVLAGEIRASEHRHGSSFRDISPT